MCTPSQSDIKVGCIVNVKLPTGTMARGFVQDIKDDHTLEVLIIRSRLSQNSIDEVLLVNREDAHINWTCSNKVIARARTHALDGFPGKPASPSSARGGSGESRVDPESAAFVASFLCHKDVAQQYKESSLKPKNSKVKFRLLKCAYHTYFRLRTEMIEKDIKPVSWTYFWKLVCQSGEYDVLTADNCCCGTCRDYGFSNFNEYRLLLNDLFQSIEVASNEVYANLIKEEGADQSAIKAELKAYQHECSKLLETFQTRIDKQVF